VQPKPRLFNWGYLEKVWRPQALRQRGLTLTAHALNWFHDTWNVVPPYVREQRTQDLPQLVYDHVTAVVARWGRYIGVFELVNEPFWETCTALNLALADMVRICHAAALAVADQCPEARLTVNFAEISRPASYGVCPANLLDALLAADVPVSSIGLQMLENAYTCTQPPIYYRAKSLAGMLSAAAKFARFDKPLYVTALAAPSLPPEGKVPGYFRSPYGEFSEEQQARYLDLAYTLLFADQRIHGITWWAPVDGPLALIPGGGLLRADLSPKPAYHALAAWIARHTTQGQTYTDAEGSAFLRGYAGEYQVTVGTLERGRSLMHTIEPHLADRATVVLP
jgi:GH35 family endo-1,4-beta-xylanase